MLASLLVFAAMNGGDPAVALEARIRTLEARVEKQTEALRARLAAHVTFDNCVMDYTTQFLETGEQAGIIADAAAGACEIESSSLSQRTYEQAIAFNERNPVEYRDELMANWKSGIRQRALACILQQRASPPSQSACRRD